MTPSIATAAAVAAVETLARFDRDAEVVIGWSDPADGAPLTLREWPEQLRDLPVPQALALVARLARPVPVDRASGRVPLRVELSLAGAGSAARPPAAPDGRAAAPPPDGPVLWVRTDGTRSHVELSNPPDDPWAPQHAAVVETFAELLRQVYAPDTRAPLATLTGITPESRERVLSRFAGSAVDYGPPVSVRTLIERQVDRTPLRRAITFDGRTLRYQQVDTLANGLAGALAARGVVAGDVVPVAMTNCLEMPLAYLALMKLGAAFVPLDPGWPAGRIRTAIDVIAARLVLCTRDIGTRDIGTRDIVVAHPAETYVVDIDEIVPSTERPGGHVGPEAVAYGVFTSGTTGTPKCALNLHRGLANRFQFMTRYFAAPGEQVVLQNSRHTFDSSIWQLFWPLTTGARTVIPRQGAYLNLEDTVDNIMRQGVTVTDFVPGVFNMLVSLVESDPAALDGIRSLRHLVVGGEEISPSAVHRLRRLLPELAITNGYGPSEASIGMAFHLVDERDGNQVPLGRPIDNCFAVVVDDRTNLLPPGGRGEILIGGACLGAGYLGDDGRTADVFIANPFAELPGERLYRTGDVGYFDEAGRLFSGGRRDAQVKIDGIRIELGEIEAAAQAVPGVHDAKALVATRSTHKALALVVAADPDVTEVSLREHLARVLPQAHLPRQYVILAELPLTGHGKVDRQKLEALVAYRSTPGASAAMTSAADLSHRIVEVFRQVLDVPDLRDDSDFLRCGGDSLRALQAVLALRAHGHQVQIMDLYAFPTARGLAALLAERELLRRGSPGEAPANAAAGAAVRSPDAVTVDSIGAGEEIRDLFRDALLPDDLVIRPVEDGRPPRSLLITGATGFVGSRIVHEALATTDLRVYALCRATDDDAARTRVVDTLTEQALWRREYADRLVGVAADLARPALGLSAPAWHGLAGAVDAVVHAGALVNFLFDYDAHRSANVLGVVEILRLCLAGRIKPLHHVSTLGVLDSTARQRDNPIPECFDPGAAVVPTTGYSRSKWVAERLLAEARDKGAAVTIYRPGEVMPASDNGFPNRRALTHLLLTACRGIGAYPDVPLRTDYTPVDHVAATVIGGVFDPLVRGRCLHVFHPVTVDFVDVINWPGTLKMLCPIDFLAKLDEAAGTDPTLKLVRALVADGPRWRIDDLLADNPRLFDRAEAAALIHRAGVDAVSLSAAIDAYQDFLAHN